MDIGTTIQQEIFAGTYWNDVGIDLAAAGVYEFAAEGTWMDAHFASGPAGSDSQNLVMTWFEPFRRMPHAPWMCLIGTIGKDSTSAFAIGTGAQITAPRDGRLFCFANDVPGFYFNNSRSLMLAVTRLR